VDVVVLLDCHELFARLVYGLYATKEQHTVSALQKRVSVWH
jgi:hypothetical protein